VDIVKHIEPLLKDTGSKIVFLIMDGLGDIPLKEKGGTPLQIAKTPHLDALAKESELGMLDPIGPGITPGSGPAHLALFGYDPFEFTIGRGVLAALGIGFEITERDVAARLNFCTIDKDGNVTDRRAGRISSEENERVVNILREKVNLPVEWFIETVSEHRALLVLRADGLSGAIEDTDPQQTGVPPLPAVATSPKAEKTAEIVNQFLAQAKTALAGEPKANMILARGFAAFQKIPSVGERFGLRTAAIAGYPMYRGVASYTGMTLLRKPETVPEEVDILKENWDEFDYFFVHVKYTDKAGEDGDFDKKVSAIEEVDRLIPKIRDVGPDVLVVTGDHSTPCAMKSHSWHPVPVLLHAQHVRWGASERFTETECARGTLGFHRMQDLMPLALAYAGRLEKFGA
jgi:2,3-bisphosphoglycerate-independent phosphoglycerate mutase